MFFVPYVLFQPPMTVLIRKVGPTLFLGTIVMTWAVIMIVMPPLVLLALGMCLTWYREPALPRTGENW